MINTPIIGTINISSPWSISYHSMINISSPWSIAYHSMINRFHPRSTAASLHDQQISSMINSLSLDDQHISYMINSAIWDRATIPPSSLAGGRRATEQNLRCSLGIERNMKPVSKEIQVWAVTCTKVIATAWKVNVKKFWQLLQKLICTEVVRIFYVHFSGCSNHFCAGHCSDLCKIEKITLGFLSKLVSYFFLYPSCISDFAQ